MKFQGTPLVKALAVGLVAAVVITCINTGIGLAFDWFKGHPIEVEWFSTPKIFVFVAVFAFASGQYLSSAEKH
ncbi:hypothetical protein ACFQZE_19600 [Paenibacillus sp. GCM10027627]|uniref:hypothetical protein n=1 Tax=unclassified Paenibacillus TaxID=185978 RepID=UPI0036421EF7